MTDIWGPLPKLQYEECDRCECEDNRKELAQLKKDCEELAKDRLNWKRLANEKAGEINKAYQKLRKGYYRLEEELKNEVIARVALETRLEIKDAPHSE